MYDVEEDEDEDAVLLAGPYGRIQSDAAVDDVEDIFTRVTLAWKRHNESSAKEVVIREERSQARAKYVPQGCRTPADNQDVQLHPILAVDPNFPKLFHQRRDHRPHDI
jgi:hypothetical protein